MEALNHYCPFKSFNTSHFIETKWSDFVEKQWVRYIKNELEIVHFYSRF